MAMRGSDPRGATNLLGGSCNGDADARQGSALRLRPLEMKQGPSNLPREKERKRRMRAMRQLSESKSELECESRKQIMARSRVLRRPRSIHLTNDKVQQCKKRAWRWFSAAGWHQSIHEGAAYMVHLATETCAADMFSGTMQHQCSTCSCGRGAWCIYSTCSPRCMHDTPPWSGNQQSLFLPSSSPSHPLFSFIPPPNSSSFPLHCPLTLSLLSP